MSGSTLYILCNLFQSKVFWALQIHAKAKEALVQALIKELEVPNFGVSHRIVVVVVHMQHCDVVEKGIRDVKGIDFDDILLADDFEAELVEFQK